MKLRVPLRPVQLKPIQPPPSARHAAIARPVRLLRLHVRSPERDPGARINTPDYMGAANPDILFVVDPLVGRPEDDDAPTHSKPLWPKQLDFLTQYCTKHGIPLNRAAILRACPPVTAELWDSQKRLSDHIKLNRDSFLAHVTRAKPKLIIACGKSGASQVLNRAAKITKIRGTPEANDEFGCLVFPTLGVGHVMRIPENEKIFDADMATIKKIVGADYRLTYQSAIKQDYKWVTDIGFLLAKPPKEISLDTETLGLDWYKPETKILTVQICTGPGTAYAIPIDYNHLQHGRAPDNVIRRRVVAQLKQLLENPKVKCFGQNLKFDIIMLRHKLGIEVANYGDDVQLLMHGVDENMLRKDLDEITRLYVPPMAGYADAFNRDPIHEGKTRMDKVPPQKMLMYGCGDTDAAWRCRDALRAELLKDSAAYRCYDRVVMPAVRAFSLIEDHGFPIDVEALRAFEHTLREHQQAEYTRIYNMVPSTIRREELEPHIKRSRTGQITKHASLTRRGFLVAMLFKHRDGLRLVPRVFTKSTAKLKDVRAREPSVSGKNHLAYFKEDHEFVAAIMEYIKNEKLLGTYVGTEGDEDGEGIKGFYKYIYNKHIRPTYLLHRAVTGRTTSANPNGQNFPKRGKLAKEYRKIFKAPPGYVLLEVDFSQIELRIAAIMAREPTMLRLYREGADIHAATAAAVMGISFKEFNELPKETRDHKRFQAKAVNFGFLYGMGWRKFLVYAKTDYGIDFTEDEAQAIRNTFFNLYKNLKPWHSAIRNFVEANGFVRAFDGRVRHLPSVYSPDEAIASGAVRQAVNSPVQGFGSDLGLMALALLVKNVPFTIARPIGFIHDALVAIAPEGKAKEAAAAIKYWMEHIPLKEMFNFTPPIPIIAEASVGKNLSSMTEIKDKWYTDKTIKTYADIVKIATPPNPVAQAKPLVKVLRRPVLVRTANKPKPLLVLRRAA